MHITSLLNYIVLPSSFYYLPSLIGLTKSMPFPLNIMPIIIRLISLIVAPPTAMRYSISKLPMIYNWFLMINCLTRFNLVLLKLSLKYISIFPNVSSFPPHISSLKVSLILSFIRIFNHALALLQIVHPTSLIIALIS